MCKIAARLLTIAVKLVTSRIFVYYVSDTGNQGPHVVIGYEF